MSFIPVLIYLQGFDRVCGRKLWMLLVVNLALVGLEVPGNSSPCSRSYLLC